jgi:hypothetical protein
MDRREVDEVFSAAIADVDIARISDPECIRIGLLRSPLLMSPSHLPACR